MYGIQTDFDINFLGKRKAFYTPENIVFFYCFTSSNFLAYFFKLINTNRAAVMEASSSYSEEKVKV